MVLFEVADELEAQKKFRFAEQLRGAVLSITNNIAEGSGSWSNREFGQFLNISRRSTFESANMLLLFERARLLAAAKAEECLSDLEVVSRMLEAFRKTVTGDK